MLVKRPDNAKASATLKLADEQLSEWKTKLVKNCNMFERDNNHGLDLNHPGRLHFPQI